MKMGALNLTGAGLCVCALLLAQSVPDSPTPLPPVVKELPEPPAPKQHDLETHTVVINPSPDDEQVPHQQIVEGYAHRIATGDTTAETELTDKHDIDLDCEIGWLLYNRHFPNLALDLFQQALDWNSAEAQAKQGLFYCYKSLGDDSLALPYLPALSAQQQAIEKRRMASTLFAHTPPPKKVTTPTVAPVPSVAEATSTEPTSSTPVTYPQVAESPMTEPSQVTAPIITPTPSIAPEQPLPPIETSGPMDVTQTVPPADAPVAQIHVHHHRSVQHQTVDEVPNEKTDGIPSIGDSYIQDAVAYNQKKEYGKALDCLEKSEAEHPLTRGLKIMRAWIYFHQGRYELAMEEFEKLYYEHPDQVTAQGLYLSSEKYDHLETLAEDPEFNHGSMARVIENKRYDDYYANALYLSAYDLDPNRDTGLQNLDSPWIGGGGAYRYKDGTSGLGEVHEVIIPTIEGGFNVSPVDQIHASVSRLSLNSGNLNPNELYGTAPLLPIPAKYSAITSYSNLYVPEMDYHHEGYTTYNAELGLTPLNAIVGPLPTGKLEIIRQTSTGSIWSAGLYSKSVTESLLSYAGARDPYTGQTWGRVIEAGVRGNAYLPLSKEWGIYAQGGYGELYGDNVRDNSHFYASINLGYKFDLPDYFEYLTLGPTLSFEHFDNNQDFYTFGQGGYFSPNSIEEGGLAVSYLTKESRRFLSDGYISAGYQTNQQDSSPFLPLSPDGRNYQSTTGSSLIFATHLRFAYLLSSRWQIGGFFTYSKSANYNETIVGVAAKYYFDDRNALFRTDLPTIP